MLFKKLVLSVSLIVALTFTSTLSWGYLVAGPGWDGPGQNSWNLNYYFGTPTGDLTVPNQQTTLINAMNEWSAVVDITWTEVFAPNQNNTVDFEFVTFAHGDGWPFDGPGGVWAHAYYPCPNPNSETICGDTHFDDSELWEVGNGLGPAASDLMIIAVHELGHALGLDHSGVGGAVMRPFFTTNDVYLGLQPDDTAGILSLYAAAQAVPEPSTLLLLGSGLAGLFFWRRKMGKS